MGIPTRYNPLGIRKDDGIYGPTEGLTFYHPLNTVTTQPVKGTNMTLTGSSPTAATVDGIQCLNFNGGAYIQNNVDYFNTTNTTISLSIWCRTADLSANCAIFATGNWSAYGKTFEIMKEAYFKTVSMGCSEYHSANIVANEWYHIVMTGYGNNLKMYINGVYAGTGTQSYGLNVINQVGIARNLASSYPSLRDSWFIGYLAGARIYNRVLTDAEITTLANELHPLKDITFTNQNLEFNNDEGATSKALSFNAPYSGYKFTINSGTLPEGVTFNASTGVFTYDGTTILDDEDFTFNITCSGQYMTSATATVTLKMRVEESSLVVYIPMISDATNADTGQTITYKSSSHPSVTTFANIPCRYFSGINNGIYLTDSANLPTGNEPFSISFWMAPNVYYWANQIDFMMGTLAGGSSSNISVVYQGHYANSYNFGPGWVDWKYSNGFAFGKWVYITQTYDGTTLNFYLNGSLIRSSSTQINLYYTQTEKLCIGVHLDTGNNEYNRGTYISAFRIYNKVLSQSEITTLSQEYTPQYTITANDLNCNFYQKNETFGITYSSIMTPSFEIIEGSLPNTITFNTTNGQFSGKGLTDDDHVYNLKVRITAPNSTPAECNVTIHTYKTARISITGKTFTFYTDGSENSTFEYTSDEAVTFAVDSGSLPNGITMNGNTFYSDGTTTAGSYSVVVRGTSEHNQTGVTATMNFTINANVITIGTSSLKFFVDKGTTTKQIKYTTSKHAITPVYSMTGTLPNGVTFDASTGTFTNDATQTAATSGTVSVTVSSSTGLSTSATKSIDLIVEMVSPAIPEEDLVVYAPMTDLSDTTATGQSINVYNITTATVQGIECLYGDKYSLNSNYFISYSDGNLYGSSSRTFSFWAMLDNVHDTGTHTLFCIGRYPPINNWWRQSIFGIQTDSNNADGISISNATYQDVENKWVFVSSRYNHDSKTLKYEIYIPETNKWFRCSKDQTNYMNTLNNGRLRIWNEEWDARPAFWATAFRAYSRYLDDFEIQQLAAEFTPTDG